MITLSFILMFISAFIAAYFAQKAADVNITNMIIAWTPFTIGVIMFILYFNGQ